MLHFAFLLFFFLVVFPTAVLPKSPLLPPAAPEFHLFNDFPQTLSFFYSTSTSPKRHFAKVEAGNHKRIPIPSASARLSNLTIAILPLVSPLRFLVLYDESCPSVSTPASASISETQLRFTSDAGHTSTVSHFTASDTAVASDVLFPSAADLVRHDSNVLPLLEEWDSLEIASMSQHDMDIIVSFIDSMNHATRKMHEEIALQRHQQSKPAPSHRHNQILLGITPASSSRWGTRSMRPIITAAYIHQLGIALSANRIFANGGWSFFSARPPHPGNRDEEHDPP